MKIFHCDHCNHLVFFENTHCVTCGHLLAYVPDVGEIGSLEPAGDELWRSPSSDAAGRLYRLCDNYRLADVCNWAVDADDDHPLCRSCRLTRVIPDLERPGHKEAWYRLEVAKRRLVYTLLNLQLPLVNRDDDPRRGLAFEFVADPDDRTQPAALTGHSEGLITINVAEADDTERERRRKSLHEPYRTLLGHMRHESGHYYWDRLIRDTHRLAPFRERFGDEQRDYGTALQDHYQQGAPSDWQQSFVSAYATAHPWEDWAETWAHYLHMTDTLETAAASGFSLRPLRRDEPSLRAVPASAGTPASPFDRMIESWFTVTYALNNLNRGMGLPDAYPFVLSTPAIEKLRFVHDTVGNVDRETAPAAGAMEPSRSSPAG
jgi:hypothetical protein